MTDFQMPFTGGTLPEFRQRIGKHARAGEKRFGELANLLPHDMTTIEFAEMRTAHHAALYAYSTLALLGFIENNLGEKAMREAAAMIDDIGTNGDPPFCDDIRENDAEAEVNA